ncbi:hypothetical protein BOX15_Mlig017655g1 [Macrostomum lignano]|uniref:Proliferation-associated SNF2-like protein n=1 Tax=Macrostomum lignano TaxID=282301 RepID=A0A267GIL6_9PLAT|nr:hypothetical protein BOX15_Mlig017655g1 [Macrostomum lignano]
MPATAEISIPDEAAANSSCAENIVNDGATVLRELGTENNSSNTNNDSNAIKSDGSNPSKTPSQASVEPSSGMAEELAAGREILKDEMRVRAEHQTTVNQLMERQAEKQRRYDQLVEVLKKSSVYAKLIVDRIEEEKKNFNKRLARAERQQSETAAAQPDVAEPAEAPSPPPPPSPPRIRRSQRISNAASASATASTSVSKKRSRPTDDDDSFTSAASAATTAQKPTKRRRAADNPAKPKTEPQPVAEPEVQPETQEPGRLDLFTGQLRDYQLEGFNWLRRMYENGINGILGDEMGLGKTVQCIAFIAHLVRMGVTGPFCVVGPLSTLCNWRAEFARFAPAVPVVLYHGNKDRCALLRNEMRNPLPVAGCNTSCKPVVITSYEMAIRDRSVFQRYEWKLLIVDEGHRVKNFQCRLARELRMYHCTHRLILTGTPIQNNLTELWSLLNFLLPEIFEKLGTFEAWFDAGVLQDAEAKRRLLEQEKEQQVLSAMQQILLPFMLRRCKADVDLEVPPKREQLLYAPMAPEQLALYRMAVDRTIEKLLDGDNRGSGMSAASLEVTGPRQAKVRADRISRQMALSDETNSSRRQGEADDDDDEDDADVGDENDEGGRAKAGVSSAAVSADALLTVADLDVALGGGGGGNVESAELHINLRNPMALLKRICNHPYLVRYPLTPDGQYRVDEQLVSVSGKFRLLDRLLPELQRQGRKVLIFSQWVCILDLLQDYCHLREYKFSRLDGGMSLEDRDSEISRFYTEADNRIFLVTTRAGGLGLNLTPADTVIIFDSDWNPQADLQAQDRCHRIGQSQPVLVFRLVTADSIDERVVSRADAKRTLERMIISRSRFRKSLTRDALEQAKRLDRRELEDLLLTEAKPTTAAAAAAADSAEVLPDAELAKLLDRSDLMADWERLRAERRAKEAAADSSQ